jgi:PPOX class probable F420-dependent enzyme
MCSELRSSKMTSDLWEIVRNTRNGILATVGTDGSPQLSNIYYLVDASTDVVRFSTTTIRAKGRNLLRGSPAAIHVAGRDFFNFAVVTGPVSTAVPQTSDDDAVSKLFEIHEALGATSEPDGFGEQMVANHRMAVELRVERIYGQILDRR